MNRGKMREAAAALRTHAGLCANTSESCYYLGQAYLYLKSSARPKRRTKPPFASIPPVLMLIMDWPPWRRVWEKRTRPAATGPSSSD